MCKKKRVPRTDGEPVYLRLRFLVLLGLGEEQGHSFLNSERLRLAVNSY